jgi:hypothetical protein
VLQGETEQFVISANQFLAELKGEIQNFTRSK